MSEQPVAARLIQRITRREAIAAAAATLGGLTLSTADAWARPEDEISRSAETIHQEPLFKASRHRVYEAILDAKQFDKVIEFSGVLKAMNLGNQPAKINREPGGAFALFGGYITGRQIELVPDARIVQAWRAASWDAGAYSIAKFDLVENGSGTKLVFDHTGFPKGAAEELASGWKAHYWEPMRKLLA
jgi:activator of HSP90 ATPase